MNRAKWSEMISHGGKPFPTLEKPSSWWQSVFFGFIRAILQFFCGAAFVGQILQNVLMEMLPRTMGLLSAKDVISFSICHSVSILWGGQTLISKSFCFCQASPSSVVEWRSILQRQYYGMPSRSAHSHPQRQ